MGGVWNDGVHISKLGVDKVTLLGFQYVLLFESGMLGCDFLCYGWEQGFEKPIQEDPIVKLDFAQTATLLPLMDVVGYMCHSALVVR